MTRMTRMMGMKNDAAAGAKIHSQTRDELLHETTLRIIKEFVMSALSLAPTVLFIT